MLVGHADTSDHLVLRTAQAERDAASRVCATEIQQWSIGEVARITIEEVSRTAEYAGNRTVDLARELRDKAGNDPVDQEIVASYIAAAHNANLRTFTDAHGR
jgi:hypothetical protein